MQTVAHEPITTELIDVTPEMAAEWLTKNTRNRSVVRRRFLALADDMLNGRWMVTGEAIKFASDGTLLDGQHRLNAVIAAGIPATMLIVRGVDHSAQDGMDTGRARSAGDVLSINGHKNGTTIAAASRLLLNYPFARSGFNNLIATTPVLLEFVRSHPGINESASFTRGKAIMPTGWVPGTVVAACHYIAAPTLREEYEQFIIDVASGVGIKNKSPELAMIRWCQSTSTGRGVVRASDHYFALASAFNSKITGTNRSFVKRRLDGQEQPLIAGISEVPTW